LFHNREGFPWHVPIAVRAAPYIGARSSPEQKSQPGLFRSLWPLGPVV
jgi:hypothetical protein